MMESGKGRKTESRKVRNGQWAGKLLLLGMGLAVGLVFGEIAVRLVAPQAVWQWRPGPFVEDGEGYFRMRPGHESVSWNRVEFEHGVRTDSLGLRGPEAGPKRAGRCRVLAIGDSFTFGVGVEEEEVFHQLAALRLAEAGTPAEALNGGIPAIGVPRAVRWLERHGLATRPDVVLLAVFLGNDLQDASSSFAWTIEDGQLAIEGEGRGLKEWLYNRSHLWVFLKKSSLLRGLQRRLGAEPWSLRSAREGFAIYRREPPPMVEEGLRRTDEALARLVRLGEEQGFRVAAALVPDVLQVEPERWRAALRELGLEAGSHEPRQPNRFLGGLLEKHGIPYLNLTDAFAAALARGEEPYFAIDRHWTAAGHRLAGAELAETLLAEACREGEEASAAGE